MNGSVTFREVYNDLELSRRLTVLEDAETAGVEEYREAQRRDKTPGAGRRGGWAPSRRADPDAF